MERQSTNMIWANMGIHILLSGRQQPVSDYSLSPLCPYLVREGAIYDLTKFAPFILVRFIVCINWEHLY